MTHGRRARASAGSTLKAFKITEPEEGHSLVIHARNAMEARRLAAGRDELGYADEDSLEYERAAGFDGLTGDELIRAELAAGWWFECNGPGCGRRVDEDWDDATDPMHPVVRAGLVYCSSGCCLAALRRARERRVWQWDAIRRATERWPGCAVRDVFQNVAGEAVVSVEHAGTTFTTVLDDATVVDGRP